MPHTSPRGELVAKRHEGFLGASTTGLRVGARIVAQIKVDLRQRRTGERQRVARNER